MHTPDFRFWDTLFWRKWQQIFKRQTVCDWIHFKNPRIQKVKEVCLLNKVLYFTFANINCQSL